MPFAQPIRVAYVARILRTRSTGLCGQKRTYLVKNTCQNSNGSSRIETIRSHFLNKTTFTESKCDCYYDPEYVDLVQTMMFAVIIQAILVLSSIFYLKRCVITDLELIDMVD